MNHNQDTDAISEQAAAYALGALPQDEAGAFEQHMAEGCASCDAELQAFRMIVGKIGMGASLRQPPPQVRARLFQEIADEPNESRDNESRDNKSRDKADARQTALPGSLTIRADEGKWVEKYKGVFVKRLFVDEARNTVTSLFRLLPGASLPGHLHPGAEECLVLEGDYHVEDEILGPGDYHCALPGSVDRSLWTENGTLVLLVAPRRYEPLP